MELETVNKLYLELSQIATAKTARELELEDLLRSAHAIAERKGADTAWERLAASCKEQGIGSVTAQPPADGALNTIAAMFHSGEEIEGPDGLAMMVDMALWNDALDAFEGIIGEEME